MNPAIKHPLDDRTRPLWFGLIAVFAALTIPLSTSLVGTQDGDGLMTALISTQKLTWYFWGQDRLLNFIPALAAPVTNLEWNLRTQIFFRALFAFLAPAGILCFLTRSPRVLRLGTIATNGVAMLALSSYGVFNLYVQHNPFGTSLALLWLAKSLWDRHWRLGSLPVLVVLFFAYATNLALLAVALPLIATCFVFGNEPRRRMAWFGAVNLSAVILAVVHSRVFGERNTTLSAALSFHAMIDGYAAVLQQVSLPVFAVAALIAGAAAWRWKPRWRAMAGTIMLGTVVLIGALSLSAWAQLNQFNIRYYIVFLIGFLAAAAYLVLAAWPQRWRAFQAPLVGVVAFLGYFVGLGGVAAKPADLIRWPWSDQSPAIADFAIASHAPLIVGGFWDAWTAVYEADVHSHGTAQFFGGSLRGHVLRDQARAAATPDGRIEAVCFLASESECASAASEALRTPLVPADDGKGERVTVAGKDLLRLTLRFTAPGTTLPDQKTWAQPVVKAKHVKVMMHASSINIDSRTHALDVTVAIENLGSVQLAAMGTHPVNLGIRLTDVNGKFIDSDFGRAPMPLILPGANGNVNVRIPADKVAGHALSLVPVQEGVAWFDTFGVSPLVLGPFEPCGASLCDASGQPLQVKN